MTPKKIASKSSFTSDTYTRPITDNLSKGIIHEPDQYSVIAQSILRKLMEFLKVEIVIKENVLHDSFDSASSRSKREAHHDIIFVMMANVTVEVAMTKMKRN